MSRPADLQGVLAQFLPAYRQSHRVDGRRRQVLSHLAQCRTPALGGLQLRCDGCETQRTLYHACRDRHCPKCQQREARRWSARQAEALLPVPYFHVVFTLPHALNGWVQLHDELLYQTLFAATWDTLRAFGRDPRRGLEGQLGMTAVMHTWGESLTRHVHLHCLIPGGVLRPDGQWRAARGNHLFPVKALARHFRGNVVTRLRRAATRGALHRVTGTGEIDQVLRTLMATPWVVYAKPCLCHTPSVLDYLARYTHRIALSDRRIVDIDDTHVRLLCKDTRDGGRRNIVTLEGEELLRRYLQHILPKGLMRVRHYGFLANRCRRSALTQIRAALAAPPPTAPASAAKPVPFHGLPCPGCSAGWMVVTAEIAPRRSPGSG